MNYFWNIIEYAEQRIHSIDDFEDIRDALQEKMVHEISGILRKPRIS
jgi:hypothetical protein